MLILILFLPLLLKNLEGVSNRSACFRCAIACVFPDGQEPIVVSGEVAGEITEKKQGEGGFGYDPIFFYPPFGCTLAEVDANRKNEVSHRGVALQAFARALAERLENQSEK